MRGVTRTEYTAQVAAVMIPRRIPTASPAERPARTERDERRPREREGRTEPEAPREPLVPNASPISAAKIGVAARINAMTDADVVLRA